MSYTMTQWQNGQEPAINAENLNKIERGIYDAHQTAEGKYSKPSLGIPKNDLAESIKNSLDNADSALQNDDVDSALSLISTNPVQNKIITNKIAGTDRRLDMLYKLTQGQAWDFDRDNNNAYSVDVPSGAKYASVDMVGGKSVVFEQRIKPEYIEASKTENGITFTNNGDGTVTVSGTATASTSFKIDENATTGMLKNKPFILTGCPKGGSVDTYFIGVDGTSDMFKWDKGDGCYKANGYDYGYELSIHIMSGTVIDTPITFKPNLFFINTSDFPSLDIFKQMFPNEYYPYCEPTIISSQTDRVDVRGKNLFNPVDKEIPDTKLEVIGNAVRLTAKVDSAGIGAYLSVPTRIPIEAGKTVFVSVEKIVKSKTTLNAVVYVSVNDENGNRIGNFNDNKAYQLPANAKSLDVYLYADAGSETAVIGDYIEYHNVQVEYATSATAYSPYSLQQITTNFPTLNSAGSVYDYIDLNEGKLHQRVGSVVLNGTQEFAVVNHNPLSNGVGWVYNGEKVTPDMNFEGRDVGTKPNIISDRYETITHRQYWEGKVGISRYIAQTALYGIDIFQSDTSLTTEESINEYLSANPITVYYELAEEIITDIEIPAELADWLTVEAGGSITFHNADDGKRLLIPSTEEYTVKLSEVVSNG